MVWPKVKPVAELAIITASLVLSITLLPVSSVKSLTVVNVPTIEFAVIVPLELILPEAVILPLTSKLIPFSEDPDISTRPEFTGELKASSSIKWISPFSAALKRTVLPVLCSTLNSPVLFLI